MSVKWQFQLDIKIPPRRAAALRLEGAFRGSRGAHVQHVLVMANWSNIIIEHVTNSCTNPNQV